MNNISKEKIAVIRQEGKEGVFAFYDDVFEYYKIKGWGFLKRLFLKLRLPGYQFIFGDWRSKINDYDIFILFDSGYRDAVPEYIKSKKPSAKIILWYWNSMFETQGKIQKNKCIDKIYTYSEQDAEKYDLYYNSQVYSNKLRLPQDTLEWDILFLGKAKKRKEEIEKIEAKLKQVRVKTNIIISNDDEMPYTYEEYLDLVARSRCILDVIQDESASGLSLRPMESLFFEKKLITNNKKIKEYPFYNKNNIFILGADKMEDLKSFIKKPYKKVDRSLVDYYDFENWKNRFRK